MPLHPQVKKILEEAELLGLPDYQDLSPVEARRQMLELTPPVDSLLAVKRVENLMFLLCGRKILAIFHRH